MKKYFLKKHLKREHGFTLIEIIVVVAIIGILAAVTIGSFDESRQQARDKVRLASLQQVQLALATHKAQYGYYPQGCNVAPSGNEWSSTGGTHACSDLSDPFITGLVPAFIAELPRDPQVNNDGFVYITDDQGSWYKLMSLGTVESEVVTIGHPFARCPASCPTTGVCAPAAEAFQTTYAVYSMSSDPDDLCL